MPSFFMLFPRFLLRHIFFLSLCSMFCALFLRRCVAAIFNISHPLRIHIHTHTYTVTSVNGYIQTRTVHTHSIRLRCRLQIFVCVIFLVDFLFCFVRFLFCVFCCLSSRFFSDQHVCNDCSIVCNESTTFVIRFGRKIILVRFVVVFLY